MTLTVADFLKASSTESSTMALEASLAGLEVSGLTQQQLKPTTTPYLSLTWSKRGKKHVVTDQMLKEIMSMYGSIVQVIMGTGARKTAIVQFVEPQDAAKAKAALDGVVCTAAGGKIFHIEFAVLRKAFEEECSFNRVPNFDSSRMEKGPSVYVPGLLVYKDYISKEDENRLLDELDKGEWRSTIRARQVQHFGYEFNYKTQKCDASTPLENMAPFCRSLIDKMPPTFDGKPDQITANEYLPGQGIASHIDTHSAFTGSIATLSLGHGSVMDFRHPDGRVESVLLAPRSLYIMNGASRYQWTHCVQPRLFDVIDGQKVMRERRVSITFRKIQTTPCTCAFPEQCDSRIKEAAVKDGEEAKMCPTETEKLFVHEFYEKIASHFSSTRHSPWPRIETFVRSLPKGTLIADIGCGNGKYMKCIDPTTSACIGGDRSESLVKICSSFDLNVMVLDALLVPLRSNMFDVALSIAVLHHLSTLAHRLQAVKEILRVLRVGGTGVIYAWAQEQTEDSRRTFDTTTQDCMVPWNLDKRYAKDASESTKPIVVQRYCHMFKEGELDTLVRLCGNATIIDSYYDESNWAVIFTKTH
ncbi:alkylated DNA repair protein alkB 8 [Thraustotheca clavata]|uniref:tRNA (carboxymethyluridine(34)-5-O)-methyltransferase n=1 Tax=Thraustotheca clavata TaxID=74557 RepID=A0A1V9ZGU4_9STRA|nr:alkylated DNA repair protein alkB 8 [Thraustotheca clavata]